MVSGWQLIASIQNMVTERCNTAFRLIIKTLSKGDLGGNIILTVIVSETWMAQQPGPPGTCSQQTFFPMAFTNSLIR